MSFLSDHMKKELVEEVKGKTVKFVLLHVLEAVLCAYTLIIMLLTANTYDYAECKFLGRQETDINRIFT